MCINIVAFVSCQTGNDLCLCQRTEERGEGRKSEREIHKRREKKIDISNDVQCWIFVVFRNLPICQPINILFRAFLLSPALSLVKFTHNLTLDLNLCERERVSVY